MVPAFQPVLCAMSDGWNNGRKPIAPNPKYYAAPMADPDPIPLEPLEPARGVTPLGMPIPASAVMKGVVCAGCGYALEGLASSGKCPECGMSVERSLRGPMLRFAGVEYLKNLHLGVCLVLIANILSIVMFVLVILGTVGVSMLNGTKGQWFDAASNLFGLIPTITGLVGYWYFTTPDPALQHAEQPAAARKVVRAMTVVQLGATLLGAVASFLAVPALNVGAGPAAEAVSMACGTVALIAFGVAFFAVMLYVKWLAMRVPDADMMNRAKMFLWLLPVVAIPGCALCGLGVLAAFILYIILFDQVRGRLKEALAAATEAAYLERARPPLHPTNRGSL